MRNYAKGKKEGEKVSEELGRLGGIVGFELKGNQCR